MESTASSTGKSMESMGRSVREMHEMQGVERMKITVKSKPEFYRKEKLGVKPNTVRILDLKDEITVINTETGESFIRMIKDISTYNGMIIISWKNKDEPEEIERS